MQNKPDEIKKFFEKHRDVVDSKSLQKGHEDRFLARLNSKNENKKPKWNRRYLSIAASVILFLGITYITTWKEPTTTYNQEVPEEISDATYYFEGIINKELAILESSKNEHTNRLIEDVIKQLQVLEKENEGLQNQLVENYDRRIVKAMISNFQMRITLLNEVLQKVEIIKQLKNETHENSI